MKDISLIKEKLNVDSSKITYLNCDYIYKEIYGINLEEIKELKF